MNPNSNGPVKDPCGTPKVRQRGSITGQLDQECSMVGNRAE